MDCKRAQSMVTPYISKKLNEKDLEEFLSHISHCRECYEELEIYFTVHYTLQRLDGEDGDQIYDVKHALQENLAEGHLQVWKMRAFRICRMAVMLLAELFLLVILMSQIQYWQTGSMKENPIYQFLAGDMKKDGNTAAETNATETKNAETSTAETKSAETSAAEIKSAETSAIETKNAETKANETGKKKSKKSKKSKKPKKSKNSKK